jgi:hypothetical protein
MCNMYDQMIMLQRVNISARMVTELEIISMLMSTQEMGYYINQSA